MKNGDADGGRHLAGNTAMAPGVVTASPEAVRLGVVSSSQGLDPIRIAVSEVEVHHDLERCTLWPPILVWGLSCAVIDDHHIIIPSAESSSSAGEARRRAQGSETHHSPRCLDACA